MIFPFEREAERGDPMPDNLSLPDQLAYQFLANLYDRVRRGTITREQAIKEKGQMTYQRNIQESTLKTYRDMSERWTFLWKQTEGARTRYMLRRTLNAADELCASLDGLLVKVADP